MQIVSSRRIVAACVAACVAVLSVAAAPVAATTGGSTQPVAVLDSIRAPVVAAVLAAGGVAASANGSCGAGDLELSFDDPGPGRAGGAHLLPLGEQPDGDVFGVVVCAGSSHAYAGFEAWSVAGQWRVAVVPDPDARELSSPEVVVDGTDIDDELAVLLDDERRSLELALYGRDAEARGPVDPYARFDAQNRCAPRAGSGTSQLRDNLLAQYPQTRDLGIVRGCSRGGRSEHKEGRAFDWGLRTDRPAERAAADDFLGAILLPDAQGTPHAAARRMGMMYVIFDRRIWRSYRPDDGWRRYSGSNPHTDHVHFSMSRAGGDGTTTWWAPRDPGQPGLLDGIPVLDPSGAAAEGVRHTSGVR